MGFICMLRKYLLVLVIISYSLLKAAFAFKYDLTSGKFKAKEIRISENLIVHKLTSIPYANVPLAFEKSILIERSHEDFSNTTMTRKMCIEASIFFNLLYGNFQPEKNVEISFDCLRADIYIPIRSAHAHKKRQNLTVLFFIHGGSNASGTSSTFDGSALAAYGDCIVIVPNYRLDILGFFHSKENNMHGNYGLHDQIVALEWLHENCENLGCNKNSVTLFGHSAGAADAMFLGMSPKAQVLINRIIVQSGSALAHWAIDNYELEAENKNWQTKLHSLSTNFIQATTCSLTLKYKCIKEKIETYIRFYSNTKNLTLFEATIIRFFQELHEHHDYFDVMEILNYINDMKNSAYDKNLHQNKIDDVKYLNQFKFFYFQKILQTRQKRNHFDEFFKIKSPKQCAIYFENSIYEKSQSSICKFFLIVNQTTISSLNLSPEKILKSRLIQSLLNCFSEPYQINNTMNYNSVVSELKICTNQAINEFIIQDNQKDRTIDEKRVRSKIISNSISELGALVKRENMLYTPVVDRDVIHDNPFRMLNNEKFLKTDIMVGVTAEECFYMLDHNYLLTGFFENLLRQSKNLNLTSDIEEKLKLISESNLMQQCMKETIYGFYEGIYKKKKSANNKRTSIVEEVAIMSDYEIKLPFINFLKLRTDNLQKHNLSKIFVYEFSHRLSFNYLLDEARQTSKLLDSAYELFNGTVAPHHSELDFVFGLPMLSTSNNLSFKNNKYAYNYTATEFQMSKLLIKYWSNFAKYGNPNGILNETLPVWSNFEQGHKNVLQIDSDMPKMVSMGVYFEKKNFWYNDLLNKHFNTCAIIVQNKQNKSNGPTYLIYLILIVYVLFF